MDVNTAVTVDTTAVKLATGGSLVLHSTTGTFYIGGSSAVTTSTGIPIPVNTSFPIDLRPGEALWAIAASSQTVRVMRSFET